MQKKNQRIQTLKIIYTYKRKPRRKENFKINEWWDNVKSSNAHLTGVSGEDGGKGTEKSFEVPTAKESPSLMKTVNSQFQEVNLEGSRRKKKGALCTEEQRKG